jgi:hypothetical protein
MQKSLLLLLTLSLLSFSKINQQHLQAETRLVASATVGTPKKIAGINSLTRINFEDSVKRLYNQIDLNAYGLNYEVFRLGMIGFHTLRNEGKLQQKNILTIIDFTKPSTEKRFYTIDLDKLQVMFHSLVAHGRNTGENLATSFSNQPHSNQSSLGFYVTGESYVGSKGYSLRLDGQEKQYNGNLRSRAVVVHSADYVSEQWIKRYGRLGRSQGCPALPAELTQKVIDTIKNKTVVFAYYNESDYLKSSAYLNFDNMINALEAKDQLTAASVQTSDQLSAL